MAEEKITISVIILDYLKAPKVVENIKSLIEQTIASQIEIIVVDNSQCEKNFSVLENFLKTVVETQCTVSLQIYKSPKNIGYTRGNNWAASFATGEYIAIVNPDILWIEKNTLEKLITELKKNPDIGIIAPAQKEPDGNWAMSVRKFPNFFVQIARRIFLRKIFPFSKWVQEDEMQAMNREKSQDVDWLQSSCYMLSRKDWDNLGGFDERYFLFLADTQMCKDMWEIKKRVYFYADTIVQSDGMRCSDGGFLAFFTKKSLRIHLLDSLKYVFINFAKKNPRK